MRIAIVFDVDSQPVCAWSPVFLVSGQCLLCEDCYVIDVGSGKAFGFHYTKNYVPCLTRTRAGQRGFYSTYHKRVLSTRDILRLQAMPLKYVKTDKVSGRQKRMMAGNAWSLNVVAKILASLVNTVGLAKASSLKDPWV